MNKTRRKNLWRITTSLEDLKAELEEILDKEQNAFDAMPEGIQESSRGEEIEDKIGRLEEAIEMLGDVIDEIEVVAE